MSIADSTDPSIVRKLTIIVGSKELEKDIASYLEKYNTVFELHKASPGAYAKIVFEDANAYSNLMMMYAERINYYKSSKIHAANLKAKRKRT